MPVRETMLCFLDTETTGLIPGTDEVVEIAAILTDLKVREIKRFEAKIMSTKEPPLEVARINGWTKEAWASAIGFGVFKQFLKLNIPFGEVAIIVGANPTFDRRIIDEFYYKPRREFFPLSYRTIDVCALGLILKVAGILEIPDTKLVTLAKAIGHDHTAHRAMGDVQAVMAVFKHVLELLEFSA